MSLRGSISALVSAVAGLCMSAEFSVRAFGSPRRTDVGSSGRVSHFAQKLFPAGWSSSSLRDVRRLDVIGDVSVLAVRRDSAGSDGIQGGRT